MAKTRQEWNDLSDWASDKMVSRMKTLRKQIESIYAEDIDASSSTNENLSDCCDEAVYILLSILKIVIREKQWHNVTPIQLFEGVYCETSGWAWGIISQRFRDSKDLVSKYESNDPTTQSMIKPKLVARGFI